MRKSPPKTFQKLASSPTLEGITKNITKFYGGTTPTLVKDGDIHALFSASSKKLTPIILETSRGFYFGLPDLDAPEATPAH